MVCCLSAAQLTALYSAACYFSAVVSLFTVLGLSGFSYLMPRISKEESLLANIRDGFQCLEIPVYLLWVILRQLSINI